MFMRSITPIRLIRTRNSDELPPFALWPAFPTSDYYGGSDAAEVSPADRWPPFHSSLPRSCKWTLQGRLGGGFSLT